MALRGKPKEDLTGKRFGRWLVLGEGNHRYWGKYRILYWKCQCDCGTIKDVHGQTLKNGESTSCGCWHYEQVAKMKFKHGARKTKAYSVWASMMNRCYRKKDKFWECYGGRGIKVCDRWHEFTNFLGDMGQPPEGMQLDRNDNEAGYGPENCRWVTSIENQRNRRNNVRFPYNGESRLLSEWSEITGIKRSTLSMRIYSYNWSIEKALTVPPHERRIAL